ncbi:MAG: DUF2357 domain-containing protein [Ardenticatenales bacterium]
MDDREVRDLDGERRPLAFDLRRDVTLGAPQRVTAVDGVATLQGERVWLLRESAAVIDVVAASLAGFVTRLADDLLEVSFGNAVGRFALGAIGDRSLGAIDVRSGKWSGADFEAMLADIVRTAATLPFAGARGGMLPFDHRHSGGAETLYQRFVYVRHIVLGHGPPATRLMPAIASIVADPHRQWCQSSRVVPPALARDVDIGALTAAISGQHGFDRGGRGDRSADLSIVRALRGHVPRAITEITRTPSVDTPENRFVKAFLIELDRISAEVVRRATDGSAAPDGRRNMWSARVEAEAREVRLVLGRALRHALWSDVGPLHHPPLGSTVLQRRRGYRDVFGHAARLRLTAHLPLDDAAAERLLEGKDIATLYELWCFFAVTDALRSCLGEPTEACGFKSDWRMLDVPHDGRVTWPGGVELLYNARFPGRDSGRSGGDIGAGLAVRRTSYSVGLRPDITLSVPAGPNAGLHLLDAKFRVNRESARWLTSTELLDPDRETSAGTFKDDDLYKMHTYRDAIPAARSVWILYPGGGTERRFFPAPTAGARGLVETGALEVLASPAIEGVGAVPLLPSAGDERRPHGELRRLLLELVGARGR